MSSSEARNFICRIMVPEDTLTLKVLLSRCDRAPPDAQRYLRRYCHNVAGLEEFLIENSEDFFVENKRVALLEDDLNMAREMTVQHFEDKLKECDKPVDCAELKSQHIDTAPEEVVAFLARFYPGKDLKHFFLSYPKVFSLHKNSVFLIEVEAVRHFKNRMKKFAEGRPLHFTKVRGHIGHASPLVQAFINTYFPGQEFRYFLDKNDDVFKVHDNGNVTLVKK